MVAPENIFLMQAGVLFWGQHEALSVLTPALPTLSSQLAFVLLRIHKKGTCMSSHYETLGFDEHYSHRSHLSLLTSNLSNQENTMIASKGILEKKDWEIMSK